MTTLTNAQILVALRNRTFTRDFVVVDRAAGHVWGSGCSPREAVADAIGGCPGLLVDDCRVVDLRDLTEDEREALRRVPGGHIIPDGSDNLDLDGAEMVLTASGTGFTRTDCGAGLRAGEILIYEDTMNGGLAWRRLDESGPLDTSAELISLLGR